jgi:hypothetical protein
MRKRGGSRKESKYRRGGEIGSKRVRGKERGRRGRLGDRSKRGIKRE